MVAPQLKIAMIQTDIVWEDKTANLANLEEKIWSIDERVDLIVLPEMFPTGFTMNAAAVSEPMNLHVAKWMKQMAAQTGAVLTGSAIIKEAAAFYNRQLWVDPGGAVDYYDKAHLFRMTGEDQVYTPGKERKIFDLKGWKIFPQICYDLRFPVFSRNRWGKDQETYDVVVYIASWPEARTSAWETLLPARAIENLCFSLGVNRIGRDGNGISYVGQSAAYDYKGQALAELAGDDKIVVVKLDRKALQSYREKFPAWEDADSFRLD
ncbi:amidohydrolase [Algoriphagus namhaensis]